MHGSTKVQRLKLQGYCAGVALGKCVTVKRFPFPISDAEDSTTLCSQELRGILHEIFPEQRNILFDRCNRLTGKPLKGEPIENFYESL